MSRPVRIFDTFMFARELDMLECRLTELEGIPNLVHVLVEARVDHQDHPKPLYYADNADRFARWKDRIVHVIAGPMPTMGDDPDAWSREHAQREFCWEGLRREDARPDDIVLHGDCDEIPTAVAARNVRPRGMVVFGQRFHPFAVDWLHPEEWRGTVASTVDRITTFSAMRDARNFAPKIPNGGWHFSWVGSQAESLAKLGSFCHPEIADQTHAGLERDLFFREGVHVDGHRLAPIDVAEGRWPRWVTEGRCPPSWFRPRATFTEDWFGEASCRALAGLARSTDALNGLVVEVGCWEGKSTIALANAVAPAVVQAVDTWQGSPGEISADLASGRDVFATFEANIAACTVRNVTAHRMGWRDWFASNVEPIRFLHIDATHTYEEVRDNIAAALPRLVAGGVICGDDAHHPPVQQAVLELLPDAVQTATLWVWQKP